MLRTLLWLCASSLARGSWADTACPARQPTMCKAGATCCNDTFSDTGMGCCVLPGAICCPAGSNFCCPAGSRCSPAGCVPAEGKYACGPVQGQNCTEAWTCAPGPLPFKASGRTVVVIGDSVSIGWTAVLKKLLANASSGFPSAFVTHSPASGDGGARSTSDMLQCIDYRLATSTLQPLGLSSKDAVVFNFGLHDYNLGLAGADQYESQLGQIVSQLKQRLWAGNPAKGPALLWLGTSPAHNTPDPADNPTVVELNKRASALMKRERIPAVDIYSPIMAQCGPVPWRDTGPGACKLCAPKCAALSVHYTEVGYTFFAKTVAKALQGLWREREAA